MKYIRSLLLASATAGAIALGGCVTTGGSSDIVQQVIQIAKASCAFVPTAESVLALLNVTGASSAVAIADEICATLNASVRSRRMTTSRRGATITVIVHGVAVKGKRI